MGNTADVYIWASIDGVMKSPKRCRALVWLKKGVNVMQFLMKGKDFFKAQQIYIYIYIYIWKVDKGVAEI